MTDDTLFDSQNAAYAQAMFEEYARNPEGVSAEWQRLFENGAALAIAEGLLVPEQLDGARSAVPAAVAPVQTPPAPASSPASAAPIPAAMPARGDEDAQALLKLLPAVRRATALVQAFRDHGHQLARIDPLGSEPPGHPQLSPAFHGTNTEELSDLPASLIMTGNGNLDSMSVADGLNELSETYAGAIGYEFEHLDDHEKVAWLWEYVEERRHLPDLPPEEKRALLERISQTEGLEQFLHKTYLGQKRFSVEGNDMLVPMLDLVIEEAVGDGARDVMLGMAHRGRLNVLTHTLGVTYAELISEFEGKSMVGGQLHVAGTGDVKYHHGAHGVRDVGGKRVEVTLAPNPSHLEFVNPVVIGMARSKQKEHAGGGSPDTATVVPVLMHGDAAFAAEGVVAETLNMARLEGYDVGGTVHIIVNNQVGFTTDPRDARSTLYSSDLAKGYGIPIVHVNADDPEACLAAVRLAMAYRRAFHEDFVIDLVGYRRHGHNEGDEPAYTQPVKYRKIAAHPTVQEIYSDRLIEEGVVSDSQVVDIRTRITDELRAAQDSVRGGTARTDTSDDSDDADEVVETPDHTGVDLEVLERINNATVDLPEGFEPHPKLWRQLSRRSEDFGPDSSIDWGHAETLAFGSLLSDEIPVRLTGQDAERGTFSHRHVVLHDVESGELFVPLSKLGDASFEVYNSPLTETAVIGFEYGYTVSADKDVVLWEAQFGDFVNVAQVMIDQFLSSGMTKWGQASRLTLLLPHGYEGQGPEHSSARLERFLQLCAEGNMRVTYPTTPAQYFHMLRRQALRRPERPMIVMTPKSLLRHPRATSTVQELTEGTFRSVLDDPTVTNPDEITRLVLCSGKVYYDIQGHEAREELSHVAVCRIELLYPFPAEALAELIARYPKLTEVVWAQEEPRNMGGLTFVGPRLRAVVPRKVPLGYAARPERASPAEGHASKHAKSQEAVVLEALGVGTGSGDRSNDEE